MKSLLEKFFSNIIKLCLLRSKYFPKKIAAKLGLWAEALERALLSSKFIREISKGLESLQVKSPELAEVMHKELEVVVDIQDLHLGILEAVNPARSAGPASPRTHGKRAATASKSLLSSYREVLKGIIPDWAFGLLKVAEELIDIYGTSER